MCLFHPPLIAARQRLGSGKIVVPQPTQSNPSSAAVRKGDAPFLAFVEQQVAEYYRSRKIQGWYEEFLTGFGLDPRRRRPSSRKCSADAAVYRWDFSPVIANGDLLLAGLANTLALTGVALAGGIPVGLALALARLSGSRFLSAPAGVVIEVFRATPPLVQLFWFYFGLPSC